MANRSALSASFLRFFAVAVILWLLVVILGNDIIALWPGERGVLGDATGSYPLPTLFVRFLRITFDGDVFGMRLGGVLSMILSFVAVFHWGSRLFGRRTALIALLVSMSLFLPGSIAKTFQAEIFLLPAQTVFGLALLYFIKTGKAKGWIYAALVIGVFCTPMSMLLFGTALFLLLRYRHPEGAALVTLRLPALLIALTLARLLYAHLILDQPIGTYMIAVYAWREWIAAQVLSVLPWFGLALAGIWHLLRRVRLNDETAITLGGLLVAALVGGGLFIQFALALLIARQVSDFFRPGYPYRPLIVFGSVIQLVGFFFLALYLMMTGFRELGGTGFRVGMALGLVYWVPGVLGVVGLWSKNSRLLIGGRVLSGLLAMLFFWLLLYPLLAEQFNWTAPVIN